MCSDVGDRSQETWVTEEPVNGGLGGSDVAEKLPVPRPTGPPLETLVVPRAPALAPAVPPVRMKPARAAAGASREAHAAAIRGQSFHVSRRMVRASGAV